MPYRQPHTAALSDRLWFFRRPIQFLLDLTILSGAFFLAYLPAINIQVTAFYVDSAIRKLPLVLLIQFSALFLVGSYSIIWRYVSISDLRVFLTAAIVSGGILLVLRFALALTDLSLWQVPMSVILIDTVLGYGGLVGVRVLRRFVYEVWDKRSPLMRSRAPKRKPALLVGAGRMGATLVKNLGGRSDAELEIRGFVDDNPKKKGGSVGGVKVLGTTTDLPRLVAELKIEQIVIAIDHAQGKEIRRILELCSSIPVKAQIVPSLNELAHGRLAVSRVRDVQIDDLLGRDPVKLDDRNVREFLSGKTVMVTGAGGSIGSELVRQIIEFRPKTILLVERAEFLLFNISREFDGNEQTADAISLIADVGDEPRMREIFERFHPQVIFHAAAHKHVPLMESNTCEAVKNNIFATRILGKLAGEFGSTDFVLISTDKAVNPTSIMGASKRIAEIVVQELNQAYETNYMAVRFGNVLGSAGSVVPIFKEQIEKGEPITVTDREMTRYFMTIPEASQLVMQAGALGSGGEIFILDMGDPVKILDLAEDMVRLSGLTPYEDIDIVFTGIRKGEKLFEELEITGENLLKTHHPKIFIGKIATYSKDEVMSMLARFQQAVEAADTREIRRLFNEILPEATIVSDKIPVPEAIITENGGLSRAELGLAD
ncbi:MAG: polysaccharide biosynthesis protein [Acidobacteria bacterium]|nr:polysaccharide biosynthesis protein [Acidobacteriota bacterium]